MADEKSGETVCLVSSLMEARLLGMSGVSRLVSLRNLKVLVGMCSYYAKDMKPIDDDAYLVSTDDDDKKKYQLNDMAYQLNDMAYQLLILNVSGIVNSAKTDDLMDGDAFLAWQPVFGGSLCSSSSY